MSLLIGPLATDFTDSRREGERDTGEKEEIKRDREMIERLGEKEMMDRGKEKDDGKRKWGREEDERNEEEREGKGND